MHFCSLFYESLIVIGLVHAVASTGSFSFENDITLDALQGATYDEISLDPDEPPPFELVDSSKCSPSSGKPRAAGKLRARQRACPNRGTRPQKPADNSLEAIPSIEEINIPRPPSRQDTSTSNTLEADQEKENINIPELRLPGASTFEPNEEVCNRLVFGRSIYAVCDSGNREDRKYNMLRGTHSLKNCKNCTSIYQSLIPRYSHFLSPQSPNSASTKV